MKKLIEINGKLHLQNDNKTTVMNSSFYDTSLVHVNHASESFAELKESSEELYIVYEYVSNFSAIHLVYAYSEYDAVESVNEYGIDLDLLIAVEQVSI